MKVLHVTRDFPPRVNGGISRAVGGLARAQRDAGLDVFVVSFDGWRPRGPARAAVMPAAPGIARVRSPEDLPGAQAAARAFAPDVVHVHHAMLFEALELDAPRIISLHVDQRSQRVLRSLDEPTQSERAQRGAIEAAAAVIVPSASFDVRGADVIGFGVDLPGGVADGGDLLYVGRFADVKGTAELFAAAARLDAPVVVAGGLPDNAKAERRWRRRAPASVELLGWLDADALADRYRRAAVLLAPSWHETFGLAVAEAMAWGVPVIASDAGALPERVTHERSGLLVPPRDVDALVDAIERLRGDEPLRRRLAEGARAAASGWTWSDCEAKTRTVYERVIRSPAA